MKNLLYYEGSESALLRMVNKINTQDLLVL